MPNENNKMPNENNKIPDHSLLGTDIPKNDEGPKVYAVSDLRALVKPELEEELGTATGGLATCTTEVICTCVPVETCACNQVLYSVVTDPGGCPCQPVCACMCTCTGTCKYWFPF